MEYVKSDEFVEVCLEFECNIKDIINALKATNPHYTVAPSQVQSRINNYRRKGLLPLESGNKVQVGEILKGTSTQYGPNGNIKQQWVKTDVAKEAQLEAFTTAIENIVTTIPGKAPTYAPPITSEDTMSVYTIGDAHIGMLAWGPESGEDNDLNIAEANLTAAMSMLVDQSIATKEAFIVDVGDYFHSDNSNNTTSKSGNSLDVDGRYGKVLEVGLNLTAKLIEQALAKHETVHWRSAIGE